jgi:flavorubredoxin/flavin reductase (DIM6/NTAB) family NADH-FMN oxidoreductase RutF
MVAAIERGAVNFQAKPPGRLTVQTLDIAPNTLAIRSLDWDRDRFDIEFGLKNGTTYNSFLIQSDQVALIDTSHQKFKQLYLDTLHGLIDPRQIDYLIVSHTEPDHSGLIADFLTLAPQVTIVASKVALQFLDDLVHHPFDRKVVKNGDRLDLGQGHELEFVIAPNLHWPDTIFTFDHKTQTLYTCDAFGMHLMGPNARSVLSALKRMGELPEIHTIATGHGPLLRHNLTDLTGRYRQWSQEQSKAQTSVAMFYYSDYGYSDDLAAAIERGITKTGVIVEALDLRTTDQQEIRELVELAAGIVVGVPRQADTAAQTALGTILALTTPKQAVGLFEVGAGDAESVYLLRNQFQEAGATEGFPPILIKETPTDRIYQICEEAGTDLGQWLTRDRAVKQMKSLDNDLDKALGRLSGGLYIITAQKGDTTSAMLASWVTQASLKPLGITIAVAKDRAIESLMHVGDRFVLNILEEGNYQTLMKHFLKRFAPGADRFAGIKTYAASNGSPILADALAFLECEVQTRMECSDHWLVYSTIQLGRVSKPDAITAVHHRKVGNHY